ncbi:DUF4097 family beta strand repeat-containing protein [Wenzhouxiangella limi]|uniref:DUF4097 domain-containing protein n=1 Tax=Wenzhouxiangella limi TaxID=2707351 RepID=A0A845UX64_9GAMM|nr:DUF4097 family beta strand repeat-containing protein [Wenzhouxiangella limi]NDY95094.1 DUF4097 domain-containing protein [Wenzhouxiangella limi]
MKTPPIALALAWMMLAASDPLPAEVFMTRSMHPDGRLSLTAPNGEFVIAGHDQDHLIVGPTDGLLAEPAISGDASHWSVEFGSPAQRGSGAVEIGLPRHAELEVDLGDGLLTISGLQGPLVRVQTGSGSVSIHGSRPARLFVESIDAALDLAGLARNETRLSSIDGRIRVRGQGQRLTVQTVSGPVRLDLSALSDLDLESLSGETRVRVQPSEGAVLRARSHSGPLVFQLPAQTPLEVRAEAHRGSIESAFGGAVETGHSGNRQLFHGRGPGRVLVELRSVEGSISIQEYKPPARVLVYREPLSDGSLRAMAWGQPNMPVRDAPIEVGIDGQTLMALQPGQYGLLDLPLDSAGIFARQEGLKAVELEVVDLEPLLYCFRLQQLEQIHGGGRVAPVLRLGFEFEQVECPDADRLSAYDPVAFGRTQPAKAPPTAGSAAD